MLNYYLPHLIFFFVFFSAAVPILYYIQRKNPNPRFRPNLGEMSLMTLIAAFVCGGMAFGLGSLFKPENDGRSMAKKPDVHLPSSGAAPNPGESARSKKETRKPAGEDAPRRTLNDRL